MTQANRSYLSRLRSWWHDHWQVRTYRCVACGYEVSFTNARKPSPLLVCGKHYPAEIMALVTVHGDGSSTFAHSPRGRVVAPYDDSDKGK
jgi:hypothetical protein